MSVQESLGSVASPEPAATPPRRAPEGRALFGRDADLARVVAAVEAGERLVTLLGPPGIGKTSLAVRAAERLGPRFGGASRVWLVDLSTARSEADLCLTMLSSLHARPLEIPAATTANVAALLEERGRALVVLDNFEQIVSAARLIPAWLAAAPEAAIVVTSRERLAVDGERVVELMPLGCPRRGAPRDEILASEAVQLFRARAGDAGARPSDDDEAVAEVVRQLDGIPLAIELAAARTRLLSPAELAARLGRGEDVLSAATKRSHERHRTLFHAIAWSWALLPDDEQIALACCAVFPASFGVASAEALVCAALENEAPRRAARPPAVDLVAALREKSLVHAAEDGRLALYLSIREFAAKRLAERGLDGAVRLAHARLFADLARRFNASRLLLDETPDPSLHAAVRREKADLSAALAFVSTLRPSRARASLRAELCAAVAFLVAVPAEIAERELAAALADREGLTPRTVEISRARAAAPAWRRRVEELARGDSADAALLRSNIDVRFAVRVLSRALTTLCPSPGGAVLRAGPGALWFSIDGGPPVDLARRGSLRRILAALCEERLAHPGRTLPVATLTARGWPNERILVEAASTRVRVAVATLRKLGLRRVLLTRDDGYLLDPEVRVEPREVAGGA